MTTSRITWSMEAVGRLRAHTGETLSQFCRSLVAGTMLASSPPAVSTVHRWETGVSHPAPNYIAALDRYARKVGFNG